MLRGRATGCSGNPQSEPSLGWETVRLPGSPQPCDSQLENQKLALHAVSC
jgi:hypothetical protein